MADPIPNQGAAPVDFATPIGQVRLLIGDSDPAPGSQDATTGLATFVFYSDAEIGALIATYGSPRAAAAGALRAIAASTALKLKKWSSADLMLDGPAIANSLLAAANAIESGTAVANDAAAEAAVVKVPVGGFSYAAAMVQVDEEFPERTRYFPDAGWPFGVL